MKRLVICGLGGSGKEFLELAYRINSWDEIIFCEKDSAITSREFRGCKVYSYDEIKELYSGTELEFTISVGDVYLREKLFNEIINDGFAMATLVAPYVHIPSSTQLGNGCVVRDNSFISVDVKIGNNVMIQPNTVIGHDAEVGDNSVIAPHSVVAGASVIGKNTYIALGCMIKELVSVGSDCILAMGTVVNRNVDDGLIVRGNPMEIVSKNFLGSAFVFNKRN